MITGINKQLATFSLIKVDTMDAGVAEAGPSENKSENTRSPPRLKQNGRSRDNGKRSRPRRKPRTQNTAPEAQKLTAVDNSDRINKAGKGKPRKNAPRRRYPWRKHIPAGTVDPITLESLASLPYPPFALAVSHPYDPVNEWPIPSATEAESRLAVETGEKEDVDERQRRLLQEQWGNKASTLLTEENEESTFQDAAKSEPKKRHYHLYDGRALAYYMVSQLQFIDPLNRRDLTRPEIAVLDQYLKRHGFSNLSVLEAYDKNRITVSSAGAAATTARGRAALLQQEAAQLLNALFVTPPIRSQPQYLPSNPSRAPRRDVDERTEPAPPIPPRNCSREIEDTGIYGHGGFVIIDDTINPHLRGNTSPPIPTMSEQSSSALWSASHITGRSRSVTPLPNDFPALSETIEPNQQANHPTTGAFHPKKSVKTLSAIAKAIKKTDPEEIERQREAREEALRRAAIANLPFGSPVPAELPLNLSEPPLPTINVVTEPSISNAQLERNMAMAEAFGISSKRPDVLGSKETFVDELKSVVYPDSLIIQAKERYTLLLKLEKKWTNLMRDEKNLSLSLTPMDRPTRVFVHEYSDFWNLLTQSYDPEGKRYIHCRKQLLSRIPQPLLSEAVRTWKGPSTTIRPFSGSQEFGHASAPLARPTGVVANETVVRGHPVETPGAINSRAVGLEPERPRLQLQERTLPLELPPFEAPIEVHDAQEVERLRQRAEEKARKELERKARELRALEAAFASDDDESISSGVGYHGAW